MAKTRSIRHRVLLVLVLPWVVFAGGCADAGDDVRPLTKAQTIKAANSLCTDARARTNALVPPRSLRQAEPYLRDQASIARRQADQALALEILESESDTFDEWTSELQEFVGVTTMMADAAAIGDQSQFQQLAARRNEIVARADRAAVAYGMKVCA